MRLPPVYDITQASRAFWLSPKTSWSVEEYRDVAPLWPRVRLRWRVPETVNVNGQRWLQRGPLSWTADLWRLSPDVLQDVPWKDVERDAEALAAALDKAVARGGTGFAIAQARRTARRLRRDPDPLDLLQTVSMFDQAAHIVLIDLRSDDQLLPGLPTRGFLALFVGRDGRVLPNSKSVYVASGGKPMNATEVQAIGNALEISLHPILLALDALNAGLAVLSKGALAFRGSAAS